MSISKNLTGASDSLGPFKLKDIEECFIFLGSDLAEDLDSGTILIQKGNKDGSKSTIKTITELTDDDDRTVKFSLPVSSDVYVSISGATAASVYAEIGSSLRLS